MLVYYKMITTIGWMCEPERILVQVRDALSGSALINCPIGCDVQSSLQTTF